MAAQKKPKTAKTRYEVRTDYGRHQAGPFDTKGAAEKECRRVQEHANRHGHLHEGLPARYEVVSVGGVVLPEG